MTVVILESTRIYIKILRILLSRRRGLKCLGTDTESIFIFPIKGISFNDRSKRQAGWNKRNILLRDPFRYKCHDALGNA